MVLSVLKTTFRKNKACEIIYRDYSNFDSEIFKKELKESLDEKKICEYKIFEEIVFTIVLSTCTNQEKSYPG